MSQASIASGRRMSTARCYLDPVRKRANLRIETDALTETLLLEGKRCVGVRYSVHGTPQEARAAREVVVSAGSINSPQLLELSGIGQPERLRDLGIEVRMRCPVSARICATILRRAHAGRSARRASPTTTRARAWPGGPGAALCAVSRRHVGRRRGADPSLRSFARRPCCAGRLLGWVPMLTEPGPKGPRISRQSGVTCYAHPMRPESKGHIHIIVRRPAPAAGDQLQLPVVADRCRGHDARGSHRACDHDRPRHGASARHRDRARRSRAYGRRDHSTGSGEWRRRRIILSAPARWAPMPMAVVDARLRVHGIAGLARRRRVDHADAHFGQYQCTIDHDRREGGGHGIAGHWMNEERPGLCPGPARGLCPRGPPAKAQPLQSIRWSGLGREGRASPVPCQTGARRSGTERAMRAPPVQPLQVKGSKGSALGGDSRGRAP